MTAYLVVRAEVAPEDREAFDRWYETEHLPDAHRDFGSLSARRGWSDLNDGVHFAIYELPDLAAARAITGSDALAGLVAEFDRVWGDRVARTREIIEVAQRM